MGKHTNTYISPQPAGAATSVRLSPAPRTYTGRLLRRSLACYSTTRGSATSAHRSFLWAACVAVAQIQRDTALGAARLALLFVLVVRQPVIAIPTDIAMFLIAGHAPHVAWTQLEPPRGARCTRRTPICNLFDNDYAVAPHIDCRYVAPEPIAVGVIQVQWRAPGAGIALWKHEV